jgi:hypothetical protein
MRLAALLRKPASRTATWNQEQQHERRNEEHFAADRLLRPLD